MMRITLSADTRCAQAKHCFNPASKKALQAKWFDDNDLFVNDDMTRAYALVDTRSEVFFMDAITGTLYQLGECQSSDRPKLGKLYRNHDKAISIIRHACDLSAATAPAAADDGDDATAAGE